MSINDGHLIVRQQGQKPICDKVLGLSARAGAALVGQFNELKGGVMPSGILSGEQGVIVTEQAGPQRIYEIHDPRIGAPVPVEWAGGELLRERDR